MKRQLGTTFSSAGDLAFVRFLPVLVAIVISFVGGAIANAVPIGQLYWTDASQRVIARANTDGTGRQNIVASGLLFPEGIAIDARNEKVYWTDDSGEKIQRANLDGSNVQNLVTTGLESPLGLALDVSGGKMYWADGNTHKIQRANLDGSQVEDLITGLNLPVGVALDVAANKLYFTNRNAGSIHRSNLDGTGLQTIISGLNALVFDIKLDISGGKMYWTAFSNDPFVGTIRRANLDGSLPETIHTFSGSQFALPVGIAIDVANDYIFWTEPTNDRIRRSALDGSGAVNILTTGLNNPQFIALLPGVPEPSIGHMILAIGLATSFGRSHRVGKHRDSGAPLSTR